MWSSYKQVYSSVHTHYNLFFDFLLANQNTTNGFLVSFGWLVVRLYVFFFCLFLLWPWCQQEILHSTCALLTAARTIENKGFQIRGVLSTCSVCKLVWAHTHVNCYWRFCQTSLCKESLAKPNLLPITPLNLNVASHVLSNYDKLLKPENMRITSCLM